jgi:DNA-damage-inducible protein J
VRTGGTMATDTTLNVRIDEAVKIKASAILEASGLTTSVAVRMFLMRVIEDEALPFDPTRPNKKTLNAIKESKAGKTKRAKNSKALIKKLNARN